MPHKLGPMTARSLKALLDQVPDNTLITLHTENACGDQIVTDAQLTYNYNQVDGVLQLWGQEY